MKKITLLAVSALMGSALFVSSAYAFQGGHGPHCDHGMGKGRNMHKMLHKLDLTDTQEVQVKAILKQQKLSPEARAKRRGEQMSDFESVIQSDQWDESAAKALIEKKQASRQDQALAQMKAMHDVYQVLTDEQKEKLQKMKQRMKKRLMQDAEE